MEVVYTEEGKRMSISNIGVPILHDPGTSNFNVDANLVRMTSIIPPFTSRRVI